MNTVRFWWEDTSLKSIVPAAVKKSIVWREYQRFKEKSAVKAWNAAGKPAPPPHSIKRQIVATYAKAFETRTLIETGTYLGDMLAAMRPNFDHLISIDLSPELAERARKRFRKYPSIHIVQGDSGEKLQSVLKGVSQKSLFWLDGHFSSGFTARGALDTPIVKELSTVFDHPVKDHVILIDDARLFNGTEDYPTIEEVKRIVAEVRPDYEFSVRNDAIRIHPKREGLSIDV